MTMAALEVPGTVSRAARAESVLCVLCAAAVCADLADYAYADGLTGWKAACSSQRAWSISGAVVAVVYVVAAGGVIAAGGGVAACRAVVRGWRRWRGAVVAGRGRLRGVVAVVVGRVLAPAQSTRFGQTV